MNTNPGHRGINALQKGSTLLVAIVLLLLAGLMTVLALNVGLFEQRSTGNDLRAKVVNEVAAAGLAQGFERLMRANPQWLDDASMWEPCAANDQTFPCGAIDAGNASSTTRANMFRLRATAATADPHLDPDGSLTPHMLPLPDGLKIPNVGALPVAYGVAPLLCRVPFPINPDRIECSTGSTNLSDRRVVTFVSIAQVKGDSGRSTQMQTVARSSLLANVAGVPTIVATGSVVPPGNADIVAMPDAAGPGLDVSIWSRLDVQPASGSFATCGRQDFLASGQVSLLDAGWQTTRECKGCGCGMAKTSTEPEGWDILDNDGNSAGINKDVQPNEFPCDLMEYVFGSSAGGWQDLDPKDGFCETRKPKVAYTNPTTGVTVMLYPDEAFLYTHAKKIVTASGNDPLARPEQQATGNLSSADFGLIWCRVDCLPNNRSVGSVAAPVAVVVDAGLDTQLHAQVYGLLFYKATGDDPLIASTGGNASMKFNGNAAVYGALLVQGSVEPGSGGGLVYGDREMLISLANLPPMSRFDTLRGGWTDRLSY